jgi:hypothetical protein
MSFLDDLKEKYGEFSTETLLDALRGKTEEKQIDYPVPALEGPKPEIVSQSDQQSLEEPSDIEESTLPEEVLNQNLIEQQPAMLISKAPSKQESMLKSLDFGKAPEDFSTGLAEAQQARNINQLMARIGGASERIGAGIAGGLGDGISVGVKPTGGEFYKGLEDKASQPLEDLKARMEMEQKVPGGRLASGLKDILEQRLGYKIKGEPTAEQLKSIIPTLTTLEGLQTKKDITKQLSEARTEAAKGSAEAKKEKELGKKIVDFQKALDPTQARSGEFAKLYANLTQGERLKALTSKGAQGLNLNPQEMEEFALGLGRLISGAGASSRAQIEALVPKSLRGKTSEIMQWVTNNPTGTEQQAFVQRMLGTVEREQGIAKDQLQKTIIKRSKAFEDVKKSNPEKYDEILNESISSLGIKSEAPKKEESKESSNEVKRVTKDGRIAIFDSNTKQFLRYE